MGLVEYFGTLGMILAYCLGVSPIPGLYQGIKDMEINKITIIYLLSAVSNCSLWTLYGIKIDDLYICITSGVLLLLFVIYLGIFLHIKQERSSIISGLYALIFIFNYILYSIFPINTIGFIAFLVNSIWSLCAIQTLKECLMMKNPKLINIQISFVSTLCSICWLFYGILSENIYVIIPNFIGSILWMANIICYYWSIESISDDSFVLILLKKIFDIKKPEFKYNCKDVMKDISYSPNNDKQRLLYEFRTTGRSFDKNNF